MRKSWYVLIFVIALLTTISYLGFGEYYAGYLSIDFVIFGIIITLVYNWISNRRAKGKLKRLDEVL